MASQFHNRLIGTVILVSVGVIFLPDILTGKHVNKSAETVASVPLRPDAAPANEPVAVVVAVSGAVASASGAVSSAIPDGVVVDSGAAGDQWAVEEVGGVVTAGEAVTNEPAKVTAASATRDQPKKESATTTAAKPQTAKPATVSTPAAAETKTEVAVTQPSRPAALQAGQIKSFADVVNEESGSAGSTSKPVTAQPKPVTPQPKPYATASKPVTATSSGSAWVVQAGVFSSGANAQSLAGRLRAGGLAANVSTVRSGGSTLYRVTVGPDVSRARMDALVPKVSQIAGTSAKVIAYAPLG